jgi:hypothetical protein
MMCKKMQSLHYLKNYGISDELELYSNEYLFPEIDETQIWCNPDRSLILLGKDNSIFLAASVVGGLLLTAGVNLF